ncbi:potassium voltage-gated channel subfamily H member 6 isoform X1 [Hydra vulgaris]|uniref:potassium voltage-gated channel subfamily H member 6 isoform X1 n=1 Tax=Hydra vulgaris TaxID=6087 RepID=UPI001F5EAFC4|nr:potassium voltage-gated channel subfamily H member 6-like isoform X1 [Hydra vulgaris]
MLTRVDMDLKPLMMGNQNLKPRKHVTIERKISVEMTRVMSLGSDTLPQIRCNEECNHSFIILHYSGCKAIWDWFILLLVMYTAIVTPYVVTFLSTSESCIPPNKSLKIIDVVVDVMFVADIAINFRTTFVDSNDEVVTNSCRIAVNYLKGWFILDFLAAFPFQYLCILSKINQITLINLVKSARLLRLAKVARKIDMYSEYNIALLLLLVFGFALVAHWLACIWYAIGVHEYRAKNSLSWLTKLSNDLKSINETEMNPDLKTKYLTALYFTLSSMTSVGFGNVSANTNGEKIFAILIMLVGALMYAVIFGNVTAVIQRLYSGIAHYQSTMRKVRQFIRFYQIPSPLRQRLEDYSQYNYSYTNGIDMNEVLGHFPEGLQADICLHLNRNLFSRSSGFRDLSPGCLRSLSLKLKTTRYTPGNYIIHYGDEIVNLMWVERGTLEVIKGDKVLSVLGKCDSFGENFGKVHNRLVGKSCASVRALSYCDIQYMPRDDLLSIMRAYPEFHKKFNMNFQVTFNLRDLELEEKDLSSSLCNLNQQRKNVLEKLKKKNCLLDKKEENILNDDSVHSRKFIASNLASALNLFPGHSIYVTDYSNNQNKQNDCLQEDLNQSICEIRTEIDHIRKSVENFDKIREDVNSILKLLKFETEKNQLYGT